MHIKKYHEVVSNNSSDPIIYDKCEFCEKTFDTKNNLGLKKRHHIYSHHFSKEINSEINWKSSGTVCPVKDCTFSARLKGNLINHYIGVTHGILDKYIDVKRKEILHNDKTSQLVSNNDISIHDLKTSTLTENAVTNSEENSKKSEHYNSSGNNSDNINDTISENDSENSVVDVLDQFLNVPQYLKIFRKYSKDGKVFYTFSFTKGG